MSEFISRHERQKSEGIKWIEDLSDAMYSIDVYIAEGNMEVFGDKLLSLNKDEGGELMEPDAKKFLLSYITEVLTDD